MNDWAPEFEEMELVDLVLSVASAATTKQDLTKVFESRCHPIGDLSNSASDL